ncbi:MULTISPECIES: hypothetical protein [Rhizobium/Agrobacterium group]|uniref:hypothetical protein n=1 Tax=Rhizobium/Agrobacterium group TaxID=227290 RepID=UPI0013008E8B|nr:MULTISPECIES: hypothetical protein [Rhizobium/Agrobacterium group]
MMAEYIAVGAFIAFAVTHLVVNLIALQRARKRKALSDAKAHQVWLNNHSKL